MSQDSDFITGQPPTQPQHSPWERFGWVMGVIWLVFLFFPVTAILDAPMAAGAKVATLSCIAAFAVIYVWGFVQLYRPGRPGPTHLHTTVVLLVLVGLTAVVGALAGIGSLGMVSYLVAYSMFSQPKRIAYALGVVWLAVTAAALVVTDTMAALWYFLLIVLLVGVVTGMVRWIDDRQESHLRTRQELNLVAERERVARDVHDVLGHSLTVITMKSQLAERLVDADPAAAKAELAQIQSMTRESLAEIRATVAGLRVARLGDELQNARNALHDAGIEAEVPTDPEVVDPRHRLVLAWVLREAVTNVVRHSRAERCTVTLAPHGLVVMDDGVGPGMAACLAPGNPHPSGAHPSNPGPGNPGLGTPDPSAADPGGAHPGGAHPSNPDPSAADPSGAHLNDSDPSGTNPSSTTPSDGPRTGTGHGIRGARERVEAAGGTLVVTGPPNGGTRVEVYW